MAGRVVPAGYAAEELLLLLWIASNTSDVGELLLVETKCRSWCTRKLLLFLSRTMETVKRGVDSRRAQTEIKFKTDTPKFGQHSPVISRHYDTRRVMRRRVQVKGNHPLHILRFICYLFCNSLTNLTSSR